MITAIKLFFGGITARVKGWIAGIITLLALFFIIYRAGGKEEKNKQLENNLKHAEEANAIQNQNRADLRDGDAAKRLRDRW